MAQPIKERIKKSIEPEKVYTLLIDGNSLLFNCFADTKTNKNGIHYGAIYQFLYQIKKQLKKKDFDYVYVFFDNEYSGYLRWTLYKEYKKNRGKNYHLYGMSEYERKLTAKINKMKDYYFSNGKNSNNKSDFIDENFDRERDILCSMFDDLYIRWYIDDVTEGDDLIAYYCKNKQKNEKILIVSSDIDLCQLINDDIIIYNQHLQKYVTEQNFIELFSFPKENVLVKKILTGDQSDNIGNIKGLSTEKFFEIMPEAKRIPITVDDFKKRVSDLIEERKSVKKKPYKVWENVINGISNKEYDGDFYEINRKIIDLCNPILSDDAKNEMDRMMYSPQDPDGRSIVNVYRIIIKNEIDILTNDKTFQEFFFQFKRLEEREIKRYKNSQFS